MTFKIYNSFTGEVIFEHKDDNLVKVNLQYTSLQNADLRYANLQNANLQGADLRHANLQGASLQGTNLRYASLQNANLQGASLQDADLQGADLRYANLQGADLQGANLQGAYLRYANLQNANLQGADLRYADLRYADLQDANLRGANLQGANIKNTILDKTSEEYKNSRVVEDSVDIIGYKQCRNGVIVKLLIPAEAKRSNAFGRKCRAEFAKVLDVSGAKIGVSIHDDKTQYKVGEYVYPDKFSEEWYTECAEGIHFFITREEAKNY